MANVKKCDICGTVYEGKKSSLLSSDVYSSSISIVDHGNYDGGVTFKNYDLCPGCMDYILQRIKNLEAVHNEQQRLENT